MNIDHSKIKLEVKDSPVYERVKTFLLEFPDLSGDLKESFDSEGVQLFLKKEFHLTIIGNENGKIISNYIKEKGLNENDFYLSLKEDIQRLLGDSSFSLIDEFHVLKKEYNRNNIEETRVSVVQILETKLIENVYSLLLEKYDIDLDRNFPRPHLTIYKQLENLGIGLNGKDDLERYSVKGCGKLS